MTVEFRRATLKIRDSVGGYETAFPARGRYQEIWAYLLAHWASCTLICTAATTVGRDEVAQPSVERLTRGRGHD